MLEEWNIQIILSDHLDKLLEQQKTYWKQRGSVKWVKLGDENTKHFHAHATIKYRQNLITSLLDSEGNVLALMKRRPTYYGTHIKQGYGL